MYLRIIVCYASLLASTSLRIKMDKDEDKDEWLLNPELQNQLMLEKDVAGHQGERLPLQEFVNSKSGKTCLSVVGGKGGLANTMGFVNTMLEASLETGATFAYPSIEPPGHGIKKAFATSLFGNESCSNTIDVHYAYCNFNIPQKEPKKSYGDAWGGSSRNCVPSQFVVGTFATRKLVEWCNCDRVVLMDVHKMKWHFDYTKTGSHLSEKFWANHPQHFKLPNTELLIPGSTPISVTIHMRVADDADKYPEKRTEPDFVLHALKSLEQLFHPGSMHVTIITDYAPHADVKKVVTLARDKVTVQTTSPRKDFNSMVYSDILIAGGSGFSRLAAVFQAHTTPSYRIVTDTRSHPLVSLTDTSTVSKDMTLSSLQFSQILYSNPSIMALMKRVKEE